MRLNIQKVSEPEKVLSLDQEFKGILEILKIDWFDTENRAKKITNKQRHLEWFTDEEVPVLPTESWKDSKITINEGYKYLLNDVK